MKASGKRLTDAEDKSQPQVRSQGSLDDFIAKLAEGRKAAQYKISDEIQAVVDQLDESIERKLQKARKKMEDLDN